MMNGSERSSSNPAVPDGVERGKRRNMENSRWGVAIEQMRSRIDQTLGVLETEFPHWADATTGKWTTTTDGDWTGGAWPGMLWLLARRSGDTKYQDAARIWSSRLKPRAHLQTAFKGSVSTMVQHLAIFCARIRTQRTWQWMRLYH